MKQNEHLELSKELGKKNPNLTNKADKTMPAKSGGLSIELGITMSKKNKNLSQEEISSTLKKFLRANKGEEKMKHLFSTSFVNLVKKLTVVKKLNLAKSLVTFKEYGYFKKFKKNEIPIILLLIISANEDGKVENLPLRKMAAKINRCQSRVTKTVNKLNQKELINIIKQNGANVYDVSRLINSLKLLQKVNNKVSKFPKYSSIKKFSLLISLLITLILYPYNINKIKESLMGKDVKTKRKDNK